MQEQARKRYQGANTSVEPSKQARTEGDLQPSPLNGKGKSEGGDPPASARPGKCFDFMRKGACKKPMCKMRHEAGPGDKFPFAKENCLLAFTHEA